MKKIFLSLLLMMPLALWAQDNTWERPDEEEEEEKAAAVNPDQRYLSGAVPMVDGRVEFSRTITAPGKSADEVYDIVLKYMQRMTREKNQLNSQVAVADKASHELGGAYEEWLVFKSSALALDRTRLYFTLRAVCRDGAADITISRIRYLYEEERSPQRLRAEEWITDKAALNKKQTKLLPLSGKFRRKTVDRVDFLFNKFQSLLQ